MCLIPTPDPIDSTFRWDRNTECRYAPDRTKGTPGHQTGRSKRRRQKKTKWQKLPFWLHWRRRHTAIRRRWFNSCDDAQIPRAGFSGRAGCCWFARIPPPNFFSSFLFPFSIYLSISFLTNQYRSGIYGTSRKNQTATSCGENYTLTLHTQTHTQTHTRCEEFCDESVLTDWVLATRKEMEEWRERERERERKREREKEKGKKTICLKLPIKVDGGYKTAYPSSITVKEGI